MKLLGRKTRSVFERYDIVNEGDLFGAARKLEKVSQTQSAQNGEPAESPASISALKSVG